MTRYKCEGTCGGSVSEEEYESGKNVCGTEGCTHEGKTFSRSEENSSETEKDTK